MRASWLNQIEIYFSVIGRKIVSPNDFTDLDQVQQRLADFEQRYTATARPTGRSSATPGPYVGGNAGADGRPVVQAHLHELRITYRDPCDVVGSETIAEPLTMLPTTVV